MTHQDFNELLISLNCMILNNSFLLFCCTLVWVSLTVMVRSQICSLVKVIFFSLQTVWPVGALRASHCAVNLSSSIRTSCSSTRYDISTSVRTTSWRSLSLCQSLCDSCSRFTASSSVFCRSRAERLVSA